MRVNLGRSRDEKTDGILMRHCISVDFLLCNKPIIFIPYDLKDYHRGIILNYDHWTPGPKVLEYRHFIKEAQEYLNDPEKDSVERERLRKILHKFTDGKSCDRISKLFQ